MRKASIIAVLLVAPAISGLSLAGCSKPPAPSSDAKSDSKSDKTDAKTESKSIKGAKNDGKDEAPLKTLTIEEVQKGVADGSVHVYDCNQKDTFADAHVPSAKWVDGKVSADSLPTDKGAELVFYCANEHCTACHHAARDAQALGYTNVYIMPAGIEGWKKSGNKIEA